MTIKVFRECKILRNHKFIKEDLWVRDGKIINPEKVFFDEKQQPSTEIFCNGALIAPGLLDIQLNGGYGVDFSSDVQTVEKGIAKVSKLLLQHGTTSYCPTIVTSPVTHYHTILPRIKRSRGGAHGATILGVHVEGPFINVEKKGAHPPACIIDFDNGFDTLLSTYGALDNISIITLAPEKIKTEEVIKELRKRNVCVSLGHSMADLMAGERAVQNGASLITHLFNAMLPFHHRDPGLVGLLSSDQIPKGRTVYFGIISDGVHTHPAALRIAYRTHPLGLILVTDAISAMGLAEGCHQIGQMNIEVRDKRGYIAGTNTLCGSIAPMDECIRIFRKATNCTIEYALEAASLHPAKCLGIEKEKGTLDFGSDADLVFLDEELTIWSTWIGGECVYQNGNVQEAEYVLKGN